MSEVLIFSSSQFVRLSFEIIEPGHLLYEGFFLNFWILDMLAFISGNRKLYKYKYKPKDKANQTMYDKVPEN